MPVWCGHSSSGWHFPAPLKTDVRSCAVRRLRKVVVLLAGAGCLGLLGILVARSSAPAVTVKGNLTPEDVQQITMSVGTKRCEIARTCMSKRELKQLFGLIIPDIAVGHVREIGLIPERSRSLSDVTGTNRTALAYALSGGRCSPRGVLYGLQRTTNGWEVVSYGYSDRASN